MVLKALIFPEVSQKLYSYQNIWVDIFPVVSLNLWSLLCDKQRKMGIATFENHTANYS